MSDNNPEEKGATACPFSISRTIANTRVVGEENAYQNALTQFEKAVAHLNIKRGVADTLRYPKRELSVSFPVLMGQQ